MAEQESSPADGVAAIKSLHDHQAAGRPQSELEDWQRELLRHWTPAMLRVFAESDGKRAFVDQECPMRRPTSFAPAADVAAQYRLSEDDIRSFYERGFIGPLTALPSEEVTPFREALESALEVPSRAFGFPTVRDRHLDVPMLLDLFRSPAITERLAQLLGPDLLIWRSQVFNHKAGAPAVNWHQATTYMVEDYKQPVLEPSDTGELFQLTIWIAIDKAYTENGCVRFLPGTHWDTNTVTLGGEAGFFKAHYDMDIEVDPAKVVNMELEPGQFVIFTERCVHGSGANQTNDRRMGINYRVVRPSTRVYRGQTEHTANHFQQTWSLENWGVVLARGRDELKLNKTPPPLPDLDA